MLGKDCRCPWRCGSRLALRPKGSSIDAWNSLLYAYILTTMTRHGLQNIPHSGRNSIALQITPSQIAPSQPAASAYLY